MLDTGGVLPDLPLPATLDTRDGDLLLRRARRGDLDALVDLLADDPVSAARGDAGSPDDRPLYAAALDAVLDTDGNDLLVVDQLSSPSGGPADVVGTLQLTRIPGMTRVGTTRLLVEAVRVRSDRRSAGIGAAMMRWVQHDAATALGTGLVQLTSDTARTDAHRFYERLGFAASHVGFKYRRG